MQQRKKLLVYPLMGLLFLGSMWLIFAPSDKKDEGGETVGAFNADIPLPENDGIIGDKRKAYEQAQVEKKQADKVRSLQDFAFAADNGTDEVEMELPDSEPEREPFRDYSGSTRGKGVNSSAVAYRDINRQLGTFYETPKVDAEKEELKRQVEELTARLDAQQGQAGGIDEQVALMEKELRACRQVHGAERAGRTKRRNRASSRYRTEYRARDGKARHCGTGGTATNGVGAATADERCGVHAGVQPAEKLRVQYGGRQRVRYGKEYDTGVHPPRPDDYGRTDGEAPAARTAASGKPCDSAEYPCFGYGKGTGERLDIVVSSIEYRGNLLPVELAVYDSDGQKGLSVPSSLEQEAAKEALANIGGGLGTSISFAQSAGQQIAMDLTRGVMQGGSQYLAKKFRTVKVHLKAGYELMLYAKSSTFSFVLIQKKKIPKKKIKTAFSTLLSSCVSLKKKNSLRSNSFFFLTLHYGRSLHAAKMRSGCHADWMLCRLGM